jgi:predicted ATPase
MGGSDEARARNDKSLALAQQLSHPNSLAFALLIAAQVEQLQGQGAKVRLHAEAAVELSTEQGFQSSLANGRILRGWALVTEDNFDEGIEQLHQGLAAYRATGSEIFVTHFLGLLADALYRAGKATEALPVLDEALALVAKTQERFYEAELYRLRGECLLAASASPADGKEAAATPESCFLQAIKVAHGQGARLLEWRAMLSLAQLRIQQNRPEESGELLKAICSAAPQDDDTAFGSTAKALLAKLDGAG